LPVTDQAIHDHLTGKQTIGVYPILSDGSCWFLAIDFDKASWRDDVRVFRDSCQYFDIPAYIERSRSGEGAHVWIFFSHSLPAALARKLGTLVLTHATDQRPGIGLESYDRFFPSQDTLPKGGFGNLIALPLQKWPRENGNSEFLDESLEPAHDQWANLDNIRRVTRGEIEALLKDHGATGNLLGIHQVSTLDETPEDSWTKPASPGDPEPRIPGDMPRSLNLILSNCIYIEKERLPPAFQNRLIRLAAFHNPEFYRAQAMRMSTYGKPRLISCADDLDHHIALPRGCFDAVISMFDSQGIRANIVEKRLVGDTINAKFQGELRAEQEQAVHVLLKNTFGLLCAPTAFGKTVVAAAIIASRQRNTLVLVHRRQLMEQWRERLSTFLNRPIGQIGQIGAGKRKQTKEIDIAVMQSLNRKGEVDPLVGEYGQVIVDEAHHISAFSFESILKKVYAKYILGLTATPVRKDGHHPIIMMQCGPVRHRITPRQQLTSTNVEYRMIRRNTEFHTAETEGEIGIQALYGALSQDV
jgi:hypothetical protein